MINIQSPRVAPLINIQNSSRRGLIIYFSVRATRGLLSTTVPQKSEYGRSTVHLCTIVPSFLTFVISHTIPVPSLTPLTSSSPS